MTICRVVGDDDWPITVSGKSVAGFTANVGSGSVTGVPRRLTLSTPPLLSASVLTVNVAVRSTPAVAPSGGEKDTEIVQLAPAATVWPTPLLQLVVTAKSDGFAPLRAAASLGSAVKVNAMLPVLLSTTVCGALVEPCWTLPNCSDALVGLISGWVPVAFTVTSSGLLAALCVKRKVALTEPWAAAVKRAHNWQVPLPVIWVDAEQAFGRATRSTGDSENTAEAGFSVMAAITSVALPVLRTVPKLMSAATPMRPLNGPALAVKLKIGGLTEPEYENVRAGG